MMQFSDLALSKRLERAEGQACLQYAKARRRLMPESGAEWMELAGAHAVFDGADSPATQTFCLGLFEELTAETLEKIERFFLERSAPVQHEVSPLVGVPAMDMLCERGYRPMEVTSVVYRELESGGALPAPPAAGEVKVRWIGPGEAELWAEVSARGWASEHPEFVEGIRDFGRVSAARDGSFCFLAEIDGQVGSAGVLFMHGGVALLGGSSTVPEMRRRGMQTALLKTRLGFAAEMGCNVAMMGALPGSESQRNAERQGFRIAYTRTKWKLHRGADADEPPAD
jgi:hypothetical protein